MGKNFKNPWARSTSEMRDEAFSKLVENTVTNKNYSKTDGFVKLTVTNITVGWARVKSYHKPSATHFKVPLYSLRMEGYTDSGDKAYKYFNVVRFGVQCEDDISPTVVGLKDAQSYYLKWVTYRGGCWQVLGDWLIHEGTSGPQRQAWGDLGCIEITGQNKWKEFQDSIFYFCRTNDPNEIARRNLAFIEYEMVESRPPLIPIPKI